LRAPCVENEVLEDGQALFERGLDRDLEDAARRVGHESAHTAELLDLRDRTARARGRHHEHRVERFCACCIATVTSSPAFCQSSIVLL